jgi:hypothetical protein
LLLIALLLLIASSFFKAEELVGCKGRQKAEKRKGEKTMYVRACFVLCLAWIFFLDVRPRVFFHRVFERRRCFWLLLLLLLLRCQGPQILGSNFGQST